MKPALLIIGAAVLLAAALLLLSGAPVHVDDRPGHRWDGFYCVDVNRSYPCQQQRKERRARPQP